MFSPRHPRAHGRASRARRRRGGWASPRDSYPRRNIARPRTQRGRGQRPPRSRATATRRYAHVALRWGPWRWTLPRRDLAARTRSSRRCAPTTRGCRARTPVCSDYWSSPPVRQTRPDRGRPASSRPAPDPSMTKARNRRSSSSTPRCSPHAPTSIPPAGRTAAPGEPGGSPPCAAGGAKGCDPPRRTTYR
jgi:hypothetical protein